VFSESRVVIQMSRWIFKKDKSGKEKVYSTGTDSFLLMSIILGILTTSIFTRISDRPDKALVAKVIGTCFLSKTASDIRWVHCSSSEHDDYWIKARMEKSDFSKLVHELQLIEEPNVSRFSPTLLLGPPCDEGFEWLELPAAGESLFVDFSSEASHVIARYGNGLCHIRKRVARIDSEK